MNINELIKMKNELIKLLNDSELKYFSDNEVYDEILKKSSSLKKEYFKLYFNAHKSYTKHVIELNKKADSYFSWKFLNLISDNNQNLKKYFNTKYSLNEINSQIQNPCTQIHNDILMSDIQNNGICGICKKTLQELNLKNSIKINLIRNEIDLNIIEKMKKDIYRKLIDENILKKFDEYRANNSDNKYEALLTFFNNLSESEMKTFLDSLVKFIEGKIVKLVDIYHILNNLKNKNSKIQGKKEFLNLLEKEIQEYIKKESKSKNQIEWIFQL